MIRRASILSVALWACACSTPSSTLAGSPDGAVDAAAAPADSSASVPDAPEQGVDAGGSDAGSGADGAGCVVGTEDAAAGVDAGNGCTVKRAASYSECADPCDAQLALTSGVYCSFQCAAASECAPLGAAFTCAPFNACVPKCTCDATCTAAGFKRCDTSAGACDTQ